MLKSVSDVILLEDVSLLSIFKENRAKWLLIMRAKSCRAPPVGITYFPYFFPKSPYFSLLFALLFGTTSPYFFLTFCWKAGGSPDNALPQTLNMVTQLVICEFLRISQFLLFVVFHSNDCAAIYELGGHVKRIDHGWFGIHYFHENRTLCWTFLGFEFVRIRNYCVTSLYIFTVLLLFLYQYVTMLKY